MNEDDMKVLKEEYTKLLNRRYRFQVDKGYKYLDGSPRFTIYSGVVTQVLSDRLFMNDEKKGRTEVHFSTIRGKDCLDSPGDANE